MSLSADHLTTANITLRIPKDYHDVPVISRLVSEHGLVVNIGAAMMGEDSRTEGWFKLELRGKQSQIESALVFLEELDLEFWSNDRPTDEMW
jgi:hypothetical protein